MGSNRPIANRRTGTKCFPELFPPPFDLTAARRSIATYDAGTSAQGPWFRLASCGERYETHPRHNPRCRFCASFWVLCACRGPSPLPRAAPQAYHQRSSYCLWHLYSGEAPCGGSIYSAPVDLRGRYCQQWFNPDFQLGGQVRTTDARSELCTDPTPSVGASVIVCMVKLAASKFAHGTGYAIVLITLWSNRRSCRIAVPSSPSSN
jgi:hypothetical protein